MPDNSHVLETTTVILATATVVLAVATLYLAYQTHRLATLSALFEETQISIEQNWRLWEYRKKIHVPVAPEALDDTQWRWRLSILNHLNLLLHVYRRETFGIGRFFKGRNLEPYIAKARTAFKAFQEDAVGSQQLTLLLAEGEGFPSDFVKWLRDNRIYV